MVARAGGFLVKSDPTPNIINFAVLLPYDFGWNKEVYLQKIIECRPRVTFGQTTQGALVWRGNLGSGDLGSGDLGSGDLGLGSGGAGSGSGDLGSGSGHSGSGSLSEGSGDASICSLCLSAINENDAPGPEWWFVKSYVNESVMTACTVAIIRACYQDGMNMPSSVCKDEAYPIVEALGWNPPELNGLPGPNGPNVYTQLTGCVPPRSAPPCSLALPFPSCTTLAQWLAHGSYMGTWTWTWLVHGRADARRGVPCVAGTPIGALTATPICARPGGALASSPAWATGLGATVGRGRRATWAQARSFPRRFRLTHSRCTTAPAVRWSERSL